MEAAYSSAGVDRYAAWVHESDEGIRAELSGGRYAIDESTRAMGMSLATRAPEVEPGPLAWSEYLEYLRIVGVPAGLLRGAEPGAFHILVARLAGRRRATVTEVRCRPASSAR